MESSFILSNSQIVVHADFEDRMNKERSGWEGRSIYLGKHVNELQNLIGRP